MRTQNHYFDFAGLDNSSLHSIEVQEASLVSIMLNGFEDVTYILLEGNTDMITIESWQKSYLLFCY
ncbi:MAG: hypothetical protein R6U17_09525 [Thermoplasmata archaeon]